jgi:hypothetical protein
LVLLKNYFHCCYGRSTNHNRQNFSGGFRGGNSNQPSYQNFRQTYATGISSVQTSGYGFRATNQNQNNNNDGGTVAGNSQRTLNSEDYDHFEEYYRKNPAEDVDGTANQSMKTAPQQISKNNKNHEDSYGATSSIDPQSTRTSDVHGVTIPESQQQTSASSSPPLHQQFQKNIRNQQNQQQHYFPPSSGGIIPSVLTQSNNNSKQTLYNEHSALVIAAHSNNNHNNRQSGASRGSSNMNEYLYLSPDFSHTLTYFMTMIRNDILNATLFSEDQVNSEILDQGDRINNNNATRQSGVAHSDTGSIAAETKNEKHHHRSRRSKFMNNNEGSYHRFYNHGGESTVQGEGSQNATTNLGTDEHSGTMDRLASPNGNPDSLSGTFGAGLNSTQNYNRGSTTVRHTGSKRGRIDSSNTPKFRDDTDEDA